MCPTAGAMDQSSVRGFPAAICSSTGATARQGTTPFIRDDKLLAHRARCEIKADRVIYETAVRCCPRERRVAGAAAHPPPWLSGACGEQIQRNAALRVMIVTGDALQHRRGGTRQPRTHIGFPYLSTLARWIRQCRNPSSCDRSSPATSPRLLPPAACCWRCPPSCEQWRLAQAPPSG